MRAEQAPTVGVGDDRDQRGGTDRGDPVRDGRAVRVVGRHLLTAFWIVTWPVRAALYTACGLALCLALVMPFVALIRAC